MIRTFILALLTLSSLSLFAASHDGVTPKLKFSSHLHKLADNVPTGHLRFVEEETYFFEGKQKAKWDLALSIIEEVMNSEEFKAKVIGYVNSKGQRKYSKPYLWSNSTKLLTNEQVYQVIMAGNEKMRPNTPGEMNINSWVKKCGFFERAGVWCRKVVGSTNPEYDYWIKLNWKFYSYFDTPDMVANLVHEWIHLLGFLHGNSNLDEEVPYVVGDIAGQVAANILKARNN